MFKKNHFILLTILLLITVKVVTSQTKSSEQTRERISTQWGYTLRFPQNWRVWTELDLFDETIWGRDPSELVSVWSSAEKELMADTPEEEQNRLGLRAVQNAPPTLGSIGSNDFKQVKRGSGKINGYPAAWCFNTFTDSEIGPLVNGAYVIGTPTILYKICILARGRDVEKTHTLVRSIAESFTLLEQTEKVTFGHSFNVILAKSGSSYNTDGYTSYKESKSQWVSPGAVLVVGLKDGASFGGKNFKYGDIVVVYESENRSAFRLAKPDDLIMLDSKIKIFGKEYYAGIFKVPISGNLVSE